MKFSMTQQENVTLNRGDRMVRFHCIHINEQVI